MIRREFATLLAFPLLLGTAFARERLGVLLLHGKQGTPTGNQGLSVIAADLQAAGHAVMVPSMPWGRGTWETIDVTVDDVLAQLDGYAGQLRAQGAGRIVMLGHSLGAAIALAYAVERKTVAGVAMLAPGHTPAERYRSNDKARQDVDQARRLVEQGRGNERVWGSDANQGSAITMTVRAAVYYSWQNPGGLASMQAEAPRLPASTALLMVVGEKDPISSRAEGLIYRPAARNPYSRYVTDAAGHFDTPMAAAKVVTEWINGLPT